ncbi:hypothetical protein TIFTF001_014187 [Ficus carica]|uniref:MATH domain-containing protein n=1 Tax=Ficus carica TaxID=3494 RepID=A0AA87ZZ30_FICCA|nr:hypothetical protein TIFTF001_014187 [Ficus carica]
MVERARERETYQVHGRGCGRLRSGVVGEGWVLRKRLEGGVAAGSSGERERERHGRELVVESRPAEMRGDRERERPKREWRRGRRENGRRGHSGGDGFQMRVWRDESERGARVKMYRQLWLNPARTTPAHVKPALNSSPSCQSGPCDPSPRTTASPGPNPQQSPPAVVSSLAAQLLGRNSSPQSQPAPSQMVADKVGAHHLVGRSVRWSPPRGEDLKLKVDAAVRSDAGFLGVGAIIRDAQGVVPACLTKRILGAHSPFVAKCLALREDIVDFMLDGGGGSCSHISQEGNKAAHLLANHGFLLSDFVEFVSRWALIIPYAMISLAVKEFHGPKDIFPQAHYSWKIQSYSLLSRIRTVEYKSDVFEAGGYKWRLLFHQNGDKENNAKDYISPYLEIKETEVFSLGWEVHVSFKSFVHDKIKDIYLTFQEDDSLAEDTKQFTDREGYHCRSRLAILEHNGSKKAQPVLVTRVATGEHKAANVAMVQSSASEIEIASSSTPC